MLFLCLPILLFSACSSDTGSSSLANFIPESATVHPYYISYDAKTQKSSYTYASGNPVNGQNMLLELTYSTTGTTPAFTSGYPYKIYLSTDTILDTSKDPMIASNSSMEAKNFIQNVTSGTAYLKCRIPSNTTAGDYYCIFVGNPDKSVEEASHGDTIVSSSFFVNTYTSAGAFKVYNSWGDTWNDAFGGTSEIKGGYYYLPFEQAINTQIFAYFYNNNDTVAYTPRIIARFTVDSGDYPMQNFTTTFSLNDTTTTKDFIVSKERQERLPFTAFPKDTEISYDLTDFLSDANCNGKTITLRVKGEEDAMAKITSFAIDVYDSETSFENGKPDHTYPDSSLETDPATTSTATTDTGINTSGITLTDVNPRSITLGEEPNYTTRELTAAEKQAFNDSFPDTPFTMDDHGTGLVKADDLSAYDNLRLAIPKETSGPKALSVNDFSTYDDKKDLSSSVHFPPYGNQGKTGSCAAFSTGYYIMTYEMAKENGWNLSTTQWGGDTPSSNTDKIMSPAFPYHLGNGGKGGSNAITLFELMAMTGCCTWNNMGKTDVYQTDPQTGVQAYTLPSKEAFAEATRYRLADLTTTPYAVISDEASLKLVMDQIKAGRCVSISMNSRI